MTGPLDHTSPLPSEISVIDFATAATKTTGPSLVDPSYGSPPDSPTDSTSRKADSDVDAETGNATSGQDTAGAAGTTVQPDSVVLTERAEEKTQEGTKKGTRICVVCNANPGKYKCPRCFEPYCSVACSSAHKATHPLEAAPAPQKAINAASQQPAPAAQQPTNPFTALDSSPILAQLFVKYPQLLSQLKEIYAATQPPPGEEHKMLPGGLPWAVGGSGSRGKRRWDRDEGMRKGREALAKARSLPGPEGEGVREFAELVKMLISSSGRAAEGPSATGIGGVGEHAATDAELRIRQELVEQDVELVKHLMAAENS